MSNLSRRAQNRSPELKPNLLRKQRKKNQKIRNRKELLAVGRDPSHKIRA